MAPDPHPRPAHHFTVDVEEYYHAAALEARVDRTAWDVLESRVGAGMDALLDLLDGAGATGTFFVLGWVARRHPDLVRRIADAGHEVASHGWVHRRVPSLGPEGFRAALRRSKRTLEPLSGRSVVGYRAPNFSVVPGAEWALDVLIEEGFRYDSSLFPVRRPGYGYPSAERIPHVVRRPEGTIVELPPATLRILGLDLPAGGGAYFRVLPYALVRRALRAAERRGTPATFYIHPWELDPEQPRIAVSALNRLRQYGGLERTEGRLERLLSEFRFRSVRESLEEGLPRPAGREVRLAAAAGD